MVYEFIKEPKQMQYRELIAYACSRSDAVMMVFPYEQNDAIRKGDVETIRKRLSPWRIKTRYDPQWPTTKNSDTACKFFIDLYNPIDEIKEFLLQINRLYGWRDSFPCDISFFKNNYCWFATCTHEQYGWVITNTLLPLRYSEFLAIVEDPNDLTYYEEY